MTGLLLTAGNLVAASSKTTAKSSPLPLLILIGAGLAFYFLYMRPRQQRARAQREEGSRFDVGDEVLTVGGIVARVLDISGDRITLVTGVTNEEGQLSEVSPYRLIVVPQAISRRLTSESDGATDADDEGETDEEPVTDDEPPTKSAKKPDPADGEDDGGGGKGS
jgi:preprotein translocase subunit YajC